MVLCYHRVLFLNQNACKTKIKGKYLYITLVKDLSNDIMVKIRQNKGVSNVELLKTMEEKITYVETLTSLATANEKITESQKLVVYNIAANYGVPEQYVERIWDKVKRKYKTEDVLAPMGNVDENIKLALIQELVMIFLVSGKYKQEKSHLIEICQLLKINIKLEAIKDHVQKLLAESQKAQGKSN